MKIVFSAQPGRKADVVVRFIPRDQRAKLSPPASDGEFSGHAGSLLHDRHQGLLFAGVGERGKIGGNQFRTAAGAVAMFLRKIGRDGCRVDLEAWPQFAGAVVEGLILGGYRYERFTEKKTGEVKEVQISVLKADLAAAKAAGTRGQVVAEAVNAARAIGNEPGNVIFPETLAQRAVKLARRAGLKATVLDVPALRARGFGGILAVGAGSVHPPRLIVLEHRGGPKAQAPIALVGKAITFDSGGISIKPATDMEQMIFDKSGGIAVLGAMAGIAALGIKRNVVGIIPAAENLPSASAYRPGDIVTTYDGKHIEIVNTDAEGRVVLADAIAFARIDCKASAIIDLATLTGACGVALGEYAAGLWSSDAQLGRQMQSAADQTGERVWPMPLFEEYGDQIKSRVALIKNSGGRLGGACTAASFLRTFAEETPWAHLDIAYMANRDKDRADLARGATGFGVRTLIELVASAK